MATFTPSLNLRKPEKAVDRVSIDTDLNENWDKVDTYTADPLGLGFPVSMDPRLAGANAATGVANRGQYLRAIGGATITKIGLQVVTQSGNICVAVYGTTGIGRNAVPGGRLATSGIVACPAVGYQEIVLDQSVTVKSGKHWLFLGADNNVATFGAAGNFSVSNLYRGLLAHQDTAMPAPVTAAITAAGGRSYLLIGVP